MSDLINRLRCRYPIGPILANGEPEFGWRDMSGPMPDGVRLPTPLMLEAADRIAELERRLAAQQPAAQTAVPEGWKVVPISATKEIVVAIEEKIDRQLIASGMVPGEMFRQDGEHVWDAAIAAAPQPVAVQQPAQSEDARMLDWFDKHSACELCHEGDAEDDGGAWIVHCVGGNRNDREWREIGRGATIREAIRQAMQRESGK